MPEGPDGKTIIVVKKVMGHGGHHGGAWKVAFADFVTAMMALFLVLWLVNTASVRTREAIASFFKRPGVFEAGSGTPLEIGGAGILNELLVPPASGEVMVLPTKEIYDDPTTGSGDNSGGGKDFGASTGTGDGGEGEGATDGGAGILPHNTSDIMTQDNVKDLVSELNQALAEDEELVEALLGKVDLSVDQVGLHLEIMDTEEASMFPTGQASVEASARKELLKIGKILSKLPNPIDIEGHTDSRPFRGPISRRYDNWDLSTDRANEARRILLEAGLDPRQIARVVGYADSRLKEEEKPNDASNRRITISMRFTEQAAEALSGEGAEKTRRQKLPPEKLLGTNTKPKIGEINSSLGEDSGMNVKLRTSRPEGGGERPARPDEQPPKPSQVDEKNMIFGNDNPFFR